MCLAPFHLLRLAAGERLQPGASVLPHSQLHGAVPPAVHPLALEVAQWLVHRWRYLHQTVFGQQRLTALRMAARGLWDGLRGRMGPWRG